MEYASTVYSAPDENILECPYCRQRFSYGSLNGRVYCINCGKECNTEDHKVSNKQHKETDKNQTNQENITSTAIYNRLRHGKVSNFGDYTIIDEVARGGMGVVYKARHSTLKRIVALKVLKAGDGASEEDIKRFMQEAKAAAILKHPNIVPIHNFNIHRGLHYFTMDYIAGTPLDQITEQGGLPLYKACELIRTLAEAISYAHSQGIIHRDIKPGNVIIDKQGQPMLTDFGLAVNLTTNQDSNRMTKDGSIMGTIPYIPPEQASGKVENIDTRSDIYSLGALFYELLTGRPPFQGMTQYELLQQVINHYPQPPRKLLPRLSKDIDTIVMKCLAKEPERRYQSAASLAQDCNAFLHGDIINARPATLFYRIRRKITRRPAISLMVSGIILLSFFAALVIRYARGTSQKLVETQAKHAKTQQDKDMLNSLLKRDWRGEFNLILKNADNLTTNINKAQKQKICWYDNKQAILHGDELTIKAKADEKKAALALPVNFPADFFVSFNITLPEEGMGALKFYIDLDKGFRILPSTLTIELGVEGTPGARIFWNDTTVSENGSFTLTSGTKHTITVYRDTVNQLIILTVNNKEILHSKDFTANSNSTDSYIGLAAANGAFNLQNLLVSVRGMNQEMIKSSLSLADSLAQEAKDMEAARVLYEKVLRERANRKTILHAYNGYIKTLSGSKNNIIRQCSILADKINTSRSRYLEPGEIEYLIGAALAENNPASAIDYYDKSYETAYKNALKELTATKTAYLGALTNNIEIPQTLLKFDNLSKKSKSQINLSWKDLPGYNKLTNYFQLPENSKAGTYLMAWEYNLPKPAHILLSVTDNTDKIFINGKEITEFLENRGRNRRYLVRDLPTGRNTIIMKHKYLPWVKKDLPVYLSIKEHNIKYTSVYGLLARIECALLSLQDNREQAIKTFTSLQNDQTLEILKRQYHQELKARGTLSAILNSADTMLKNSDELSNQAWTLLEAARTLANTDDGNKLAIRYNRLADKFIKTGNYDQARDLFKQAITLLPDWPVPLFERAKLLYRQENLWYEGVSAFDEALKKLPNSLELRLQIAEFFLNPGRELTPNPEKQLTPLPERALTVAEEAVFLSKRKSPKALNICAEALLAMNKNKEALKFIQEALLLEKTPELLKFRDRIMHKINTKK